MCGTINHEILTVKCTNHENLIINAKVHGTMKMNGIDHEIF